MRVSLVVVFGFLLTAVVSASDKPLLHKGKASSWPATNWTRESLRTQCGVHSTGCGTHDAILFAIKEVTPNVVSVHGGLSVHNVSSTHVRTIADAIGFMESGNDTVSLVVDQASLDRSCPRLLQDVRFPNFIGLDLLPTMGLNLFCNVFRKYPALHVFPKGVVQRARVNADYTSQWYAVLSGKQTWRLIPPSRVAVLNPKRKKFPETFYDVANVWKRTDVDMETIEVSAGDVLYVPAGWAYQVTYEEDVIAVSGLYVNWDAVPTHEDYYKTVSEADHSTYVKLYTWVKAAKEKLDSLPKPNEDNEDLTTADAYIYGEAAEKVLEDFHREHQASTKSFDQTVKEEKQKKPAGGEKKANDNQEL